MAVGMGRGKELRELREAAGLTIVEVVREVNAVGINTAYLSQAERGLEEATLTEERVELIAAAIRRLTQRKLEAMKQALRGGK